ncbi:MAG: threonine synthase [Firmicutes bacterium]|nr:threonine synthase [Bacillota bacterium]
MKLKYTTTRSNINQVTSSQAILNGLGDDGGLYLPINIPKISIDEINSMINLTYNQKAQIILSKYLTDFTQDELEYCINNAYNEKTFSSPKITPLHLLNDKCGVLELYHGPTSAFKDVALQILPYLLTTSAKKNGDKRTYVILVATSGDTGKAALEGFKDVPNTKILVFYPNDGVSLVQKLQMVTQLGENIKVVAVEGNFDDTQNGVKELFSNTDITKKLGNINHTFSSANSINWGRLVPQIVYYFESYVQLLNSGTIKIGEKINFTVPTGNFGNILAGYYAKEMGLPIKKLICAANANDVLKKFFDTGIYNRNREFVKTLSPSMDILISSNLERLLFLLSEGNKELITKLMLDLKNMGYYQIPEDIFKKLTTIFYSESADDIDTIKTIRDLYQKNNYLVDTHTAVAYKVYEKYQLKTNDNTFNVIVSTASPYKFNGAVAKAILSNYSKLDDIEQLKAINELTHSPIPEGLKNLDSKVVRFKDVISSNEMELTLKDYLKI